jgi:hypothetical protein
MGVGGQSHVPTALPPRKDAVPIVQEAGWAPGPFSTGAENLAPMGIRSPGRPAGSESLYLKHVLSIRNGNNTTKT